MELEDARRFWRVAGAFPADKERVYPGHAEAHGFDDQRGKRVLEYGCGGGSDTLSLARRGARVTYVDIVPENVARTRERVQQLGRLEQPVTGHVLVDSARVGGPDDLFDTVTCHGVLHHIPDPKMHEVLEEFRRVLKLGGVLYAMLYTEHLFGRFVRTVDPTADAIGAVIQEDAFGRYTDGGGIARAYTLTEGRGLFEAHGFEFRSAVEYNNLDFRTFRVKKV